MLYDGLLYFIILTGEYLHGLWRVQSKIATAVNIFNLILYRLASRPLQVGPICTRGSGH